MDPQNKTHRIILTSIIAVLFAGLSGGGVWYYLNGQNKAQDELIDELSKDTTIEEKTETKIEETETKKETVPSSFTKIILNGTEINYPSAWGTPEKTTTVENLAEIAFPEFSGENAVFKASEFDWVGSFTVNDLKSYEEYSYVSETITLLKKIYEDRETTPEEVIGVSYIPPVNAGTSEYNPRYVENDDGTWRGYWYLATQGQSISAQVLFVGILYNKGEGKVATINWDINSAGSKVHKDKIEASNGSDWDAIGTQIEAYMKTAYATDTEVKKTVDKEALKVLQFIK